MTNSSKAASASSAESCRIRRPVYARSREKKTIIVASLRMLAHAIKAAVVGRAVIKDKNLDEHSPAGETGPS
jgi:hypothetical protein